MVTGWRRAFCTSIPKEERETALFNEHSNKTSNKRSSNNDNDKDGSGHSPRISSKFGFFSNPSTPRLQTQPRSSPIRLRCRTTAVATTTRTSSVPNSPKLQCKTPTPKSHNNKNSPRLFHFTNPWSPRSPSSLSFLKATIGLSKSKSNQCGICLQSVESRQGTAIFTAECNHVFHFPCVASHVQKQQLLICPVCKATWKELPLLSSHQIPETNNKEESKNKAKDVHKTAKNFRVYNDDETLFLLSPGSLFNPIPELEENEVEDEQDGNNSDLFQFQSFFVNPALAKVTKDVEVSLLPESAVLAVGRNHETRVVVLKVRAPPAPVAARRAPIDLVVVLDVSDRMRGLKSQTMKRAMRLMISSLGSNDRMSIVAFSSSSKRLLPLLRMTATGRRSARRTVDALGSTGQGMSVIDAVKKAAKVIEDRREKNPVATIMIFSNGLDERPHISSINHQKRSSSSFVVSSTRFSHLEIPVHAIAFGESHAPSEDALGKCIRGLLSVTIQDLRLQLRFAPGSAQAEIPAVYPVGRRPAVSGPGSVRVGDLHAEEERELLVELKVPASSVGPHHLLVRSSFIDPLSRELAFSEELARLIPQPQAVRSPVPGIQRLRNIHVSTRAVAESRRLMEHNDLSGAYRLLSSARALLMQSGDGSAGEYVQGLEAELAELHRRRQHMVLSQRQRSGQQEEEKPEPLTPTSAWRAAERLAKLAIMRKHMNRVSDLHGFENARF